MNKKLLLIGGGGHCKSVLDTLYRLGTFDELGIIDIPSQVGKFVLETPIIGTDEDLPELFKKGFNSAFVTIGAIDSHDLKIRLVKRLSDLSFTFPNIIDPSVEISTYGEIGEGVFIGKSVIVNANYNIGSFAIINSGSICEHDTEIGDYTHVAPNTTILGGVKIGDRAHIGAASIVKQGTNIGTNTIIGMGSNVLSSIDSNVIAYGNPCKVVGQK
ncbi:acetyltransferase [Oceanobacillus kimchii]|uniref:acetyltransferase n=1 Tax=Oceanobacillus kimchii TaxID=746691 RepID=UPI0009857FD6|nr:acetyltransferase [Oceanobacillus kimchii]